MIQLYFRWEILGIEILGIFFYLQGNIWENTEGQVRLKLY